MSQLALAHERQLIQKGCSLHLTVTHPRDSTTLTKQTQPTDNSNTTPPTIKLQMIKKGLSKEEYVDIDFDKINNSFASWNVGYAS